MAQLFFLRWATGGPVGGRGWEVSGQGSGGAGGMDGRSSRQGEVIVGVREGTERAKTWAALWEPDGIRGGLQLPLVLSLTSTKLALRPGSEALGQSVQGCIHVSLQM